MRLMSFSEIKQAYREKERPVVISSLVVFLGLIGLLSVGLSASIISIYQLSGTAINATADLLIATAIFLFVSVVGLLLTIVAMLLTDQ